MAEETDSTAWGSVGGWIADRRRTWLVVIATWTVLVIVLFVLGSLFTTSEPECAPGEVCESTSALTQALIGWAWGLVFLALVESGSTGFTIWQRRSKPN